MSGYPYQNLSSASFEIRLLTLEPASRESGIVCSLRHALLTPAPRYEALSYVWGDPTATRGIVIDGAYCTVTESLEVALRYIRQEDVARTLWVDAVCINQSNLEERAQQVQRMRDIYKTAERVLAWTGVATTDSDEAIDLMTEFGQFMMKEYGQAETPCEPILELMRSRGLNPTSRNWPALWSFWKRPYWNRIWIIQELSSCFDIPDPGDLDSKYKRCLIGCGSRWVPFTLFAYSAVYFDLLIEMHRLQYFEVAGDELQTVDPMRSWTVAQPVYAVRMFAALRIHSDSNDSGCNENSICKMLRVSTSFMATDVRDKLFALLGLSQEYGQICPDYTKSATEVFTSLVKFCIMDYDRTAASSQLEILYGNRHRRNACGPSWIPEFYGLDTLSTLWDVHYAYFSAGGARSSATVAFDKSERFLTVQGITVGMISDTIGPIEKSKPATPTVDVVSANPSIKRAYDQFIAFASPLSEPRWQKFWRTLLGDQDAPDRDNIVRPAPSELGQSAGTLFRLDRIPDTFMADSPDFERYINYIRGFDAQMLNNLTERCFFTTETGDMGIGPYTTRTGDVAVILLGGIFCFVLRSVGRNYELVGDAYIHGIMKGELLKELKDGKVKLQSFTLC